MAQFAYGEGMLYEIVRHASAADGIALNQYIRRNFVLDFMKIYFQCTEFLLRYIYIYLINNNNNNSNNKSNISNNIKKLWKTAVREERKEDIRDRNWQRKFLGSKWNEEEINQQSCFVWLTSWKDAVTHTIAAMMELYEQLTLTKLYTSFKTRTPQGDDVKCRMCGKTPESLTRELTALR